MARIRIAENTAAHTPVYTYAGRITAGTTFTLAGEDAAAFDVSADGIVTLRVSPDREVQAKYRVTLVATTGDQARTEKVTVDILDVNDNAPVFVSGASASVAEGTDVRAPVYRARAEDADGDRLTWSLGGADADLLRIDSRGNVTLRRKADFESRDSYSFEVTASDGVHSVSQQVVVSVLNVNESPPQIVSGARGSVTENAPVSTVVYKAVGKDPDGTALAFSLAGADAALLEISETGDVTLRAPADFEAKSSYSFDVVASDGESSVSKAVVVTVANALPAVAAIAITSAEGVSGNWLSAGDVVTVTLTMSDAVTVTGTPTLVLDVGGTPLQATYVGGSGGTALTFTATIAAGMADADGISIDANSLAVSGGTLREAAGVATLGHAAVADDGAFRVDTTAPTVAIASSAAILQPGEAATITFTFSEDPGTSFALTDVLATGGTLSALAGSGLVRTATFTAVTGATLSTGARIALPPGNFTDAAGNAGTGTAPRLEIATVFNEVLFVGNSATFGRDDPVLRYNTYDAETNPGGVHDLTSPDRGGAFANLTGTNLYEPHDWGGVPGLVDAFAEELGLSWDVSLSTRNAATLRGHYANTSPGGWDMRGNIASQEWDMVVLQDQTDEPLPSGSGFITFAAGSSTATLAVTPRADSVNEVHETLALSLAASTGYRVGTSTAITTTISNDDPTPPATNPALPTVTLAATSGSAAEDGTGNLVFTFTRTGAADSALTVTFTAFRDGALAPSVGSAAATQDLEFYNAGVLTAGTGSVFRFTAGGGFANSSSTGPNTTTGSVSFTSNTGQIVIPAGATSASITLDPRADANLEGDESVRLQLTGTAYNIGTLGQVQATIVNDDFVPGPGTNLPNVTLALGSAATAYEDAGQQLLYTFTRSGSTAEPLTVYFNETGTATYFAGSPAQSDFSIATTGAAGVSLVTTSGSNADIGAFEMYATLIENYVHTGAADTTTVPGTTIPANPNADPATDVYLYATWARPDMVVGAWDMLTEKIPVTSGPQAGAFNGGSITQSAIAATGYYLTLEEMSADLTAAYTNLATANPDFEGVAPVSTAFMNAVLQGVSIRDPYTETDAASVASGKINLWYDDNLHASKYGSYLAGLVLLGTMAGLDPRALGAGDSVAADLGIDAATAVALQQVASATLGLEQDLHWTAPGRVTDLGGTGASETLATAGAFTFVDATHDDHSVSVTPQAGNLGTLTAQVRSDGHAGQVNWLYTVDNAAIDALLGAADTRTEYFTIALDDGHGHVVTELVGVQLVGG